MIQTDIIIIGAGPVGLFTVFEAGLLKLKCHLIDSFPQPGGQCSEIYPKKPIYDIPGFPSILAGELIDNLMTQAAPFKPGFTLGEAAQDIEKLADGTFVVTTVKGTQHHAPIVMIAGGLGVFEPRKPPIESLSIFEEKGVEYIIKDPNFYQDIIKNRIATLTHRQWLDQLDNFYTVSGDAGDTVWAVIDDSFWNQHHQNFNTPWRDWIIPSSNSPSVEFIEEFCSWSGTKIHTVLELRTWFYLCCKWQDKAMLFFSRTPGITPLSGNGFYNLNNDFRVWTMNNLDKIIGNSWQDYKIPAKEFINDFHKDTNWFATKTKVYSASIDLETTMQMILDDHCTFAISDDYKSHSFKSWPFVDPVYMEDWNDQYDLWPKQLFEPTQ